ncbi:MAG: hypothetical protein JWR21_1254 [Herminiimonas sp.]|nr:hypothetical protein [Herminiimonas sp.]
MNDPKEVSAAFMAGVMSPEQRAFLKSVVNYKYQYSPELVPQLVEFGLIMNYGRLLIPTRKGREVAKHC